MHRNSIASTHERFFRKLSRDVRKDKAEVAKQYAKALYKKGAIPVAKHRKVGTYHFGLNVAPSQFSSVTKRAVLVADTLMLSQDHTEAYVPLDSYADHDPAILGPDGEDLGSNNGYFAIEYGMNCSDLRGLGRWILDSEDLMRKGILWYLPAYQEGRRHTLSTDGNVWDSLTPSPIRPIDYLVSDKRALLNVSGAPPEKTELIRPVLTVDLPFLEAASLKDFSKITVDEFGAYENFKTFLRVKLTEMDDAANAVESERELRKLAREIEQGIREVSVNMDTSKRTRWAHLAGVGIHAISATLFAVADLKTLQYVSMGAAMSGTTPLVSNFFKSVVDDRPRKQRNSHWYYVWALHEHTERSK